MSIASMSPVMCGYAMYAAARAARHFISLLQES